MPTKLGVRKKKSNPLFIPTPSHRPSSSAPKISLSSSPLQMGSSSPFLGFSAQSDPSEKTALLAPKESPGSSNRSSPERKTGGTARIDMIPRPRRNKIPYVPNPGTRERRKDIPRYVPTDWDDSLPYGGKVYLARKKKPDTWLCFGIQVFLVIFAFGMMYYAWYHTDHMHFHATKLYGHLGHMQAQAMTAEKYLHGKGVERNHSEAMVWYKKAADQGHPHSAYNLAVGHLQGLNVGLLPGQAHDLIKHAASNGVIEAAEVLTKVCSRGRCDQ